MPSAQARYWICTASYARSRVDDCGDLLVDPWTPNTFFADNDDVIWVLGQREIGVGENGFEHYQFVFSTKKKITLTKAKSFFPVYLSPHLEATKSAAAEEYVRKEETRVPGSQFELGVMLDEYISHR